MWNAYFIAPILRSVFAYIWDLNIFEKEWNVLISLDSLLYMLQKSWISILRTARWMSILSWAAKHPENYSSDWRNHNNRVDERKWMA